MDYSRSRTRSLAGAISDRYADSLEAVVCIGDVTEDVDNFCVQTKERDGYPVLEHGRVERRLGCARAVEAMVEGLGVRAHAVCDSKVVSEKRRIIAGGRVLCRLDRDRPGFPIRHLHPGALVLVVDYAKGAIDDETMRLIGEKYAGQEIIADWHPSRPLDFYRCATALKASWDAPHDGSRPFIRTMGENGMFLYLDGSLALHLPAANLKPVDCCGAGDMVLATLGAGRRLGLSWEECCRWAADNAAWKCSQWGSVPRPMTYQEWRATKDCWQGEANEQAARAVSR